MDLSFNDAKLLFYTKIREDATVKEIGTESRIKSLVESMIEYASQVNKVNQILQQREMKRLSIEFVPFSKRVGNNGAFDYVDFVNEVPDSFKAKVKQRAKPLILDFSDVKSIAYTIGTHSDKRSWIRRQFTKDNPLEQLMQKYSQNYSMFLQRGVLDPKYLDGETIDYLNSRNQSVEQENQIDCLTRLFEKSFDYAERQFTLLTLSGKEEVIHTYHAEGIGKRRIFTEEETGIISEYFRMQSEIDGILFKTLYATGLSIKGISNFEELTEHLHQDMINCYRNEGYIDTVVIQLRKD